MKHCKPLEDAEKAKAADMYPGAAAAPDCHVDPAKVKKELEELNNNPNNTNDEMPDGPDTWASDDQL